jgi:hypothetical protein
MSEPAWAPIMPPAHGWEEPVLGKWAKGEGGAVVWDVMPDTFPGIITPDADWKVIGVDVAFENGWTAHDSGAPWAWSPPRFRKTAEGLVLLDGMIGWGGGTSNAVAFTLPVGYRPGKHVGANYGPHHFHVATYGDGPSYRLLIWDTGSVVPYVGGASNWVSLNGMTFLAGG